MSISTNCKGRSFYFLAAAFFGAADLFAGLAFAGLFLPKLPANIFPFFVLMSPRPICFVCYF